RLAGLRLRSKRTLRITLAWVVVGLMAALFEHNALVQHGATSVLLQRIDERFLRSLVAGFVGGGIYIFLLRDRLRKFPYFTALGIMAAIMLPVMGFTSAVWPALRSPEAFGTTFLDHLLSLRFLGHYVYWTLLMGGSMFMVRLNDQYGSGGISYLTGRYHKPREEMRVFMFLDMRSSTAIAEELGHVKYFQLLNELYADITDPIVYSRGEIYQYVGDEISVSWPLRRGVGRLRCIRCFLDIRTKLQSRAAHYEQRYGLAPAFKAGFHYGQVTTGEVGLVKKERIFSGDVVNTAARIQNSCNEHGVDNLLSKELLDLLRPQAKFRVREIGSIALKGKRHAMSLWTIVHDVPAAQPESRQVAAQNV
ncbi:MAG TPA: adenylate/guanylate cyclase domain-containing protein, partial [Flavobacteriales bacterium]|nr:adenylate/guanylate cyclase domain-containing protein [Flavobacteriales bacterium]